MNPTENRDEALDLLQLLGLSEYEARCYVGLTQVEAATSKTLSEVTEVPRTRVYDAIRVLEAQGLVEVQHTSPKRFRAVPVQEAIDRIRNRYQARFAELQEALNTLETLESKDETHTQQVWSVSGREAVEFRAIQLVNDASAEVVLALGEESLLTDAFAKVLTEAGENVQLVIYTPTEALRDRVQGIVPVSATVLPGLKRLHDPTITGAQAVLGRILVIDQATSLISSIDLDTNGEQAIFSQGPKTPLVLLISQLLAEDGLFIAPEFGL